MSAESVDHLSSWKDGTTKQSIVEFLASITGKNSFNFVAPEDRIAVFDNDGTLWCEKPLPIQADFLLRRIGEQVAQDPSLRDKQPWKAVSEKDYKWLSNVITKHYQGDDSDLKVMAAGLLSAYSGESIESFAEKAEQFLRSARNPALKRPYLETAYQPMVELLQYLTANGFQTYIASGGTRDFMRPITGEIYGIPPERVIGSTVALEYRVVEGRGDVFHKPDLEVLDDGPAKPVRIWSRIGRRPIFCAGNANGDLQMLEFTSSSPRSFCLVVDHDDNEREIAYSAGAEQLLQTAKARGWAIASVKDDWLNVFAEAKPESKSQSTH